MTEKETPGEPVAQRPGELTDDLEDLGPVACDEQGAHFVLILYVASLTPRSVTAIQSVKSICETHLQGQCELEIIDIYEHPSLAKGEQIVAAPTLIKKLPLPLRRLIGDMADQQRVLVGLDLRAKGDASDSRR
ncbi:circadian clock KaiB family protein [Thiorhodococcus minor]|uniref:Thiol-disulfide isomerase n=1 Tax=Thiorhodococcus minor TaxID=57489 RepID=A0A6M0K509_9GAMM|nr:circadian clock KaiB family protein [Thiorhodococcus minor]NEV64790.1 thiol-disulfide isomerase [Thiorhodococcus minor]